VALWRRPPTTSEDFLVLDFLRRLFSSTPHQGAPVAAGPVAAAVPEPRLEDLEDLAHFDLHLDGSFYSSTSPEVRNPVRASLTYRDEDPHAVLLTFMHLPNLLGRDLLVKAALAEPGTRIGDVDTFIHVELDVVTFELLNRTTSRSVMLEVPRAAIPTFLDATSGAFSAALERTRASYDEELTSLLS
jgi:hypothetical protein